MSDPTHSSSSFCLKQIKTIYNYDFSAFTRAVTGYQFMEYHEWMELKKMERRWME